MKNFVAILVLGVIAIALPYTSLAASAANANAGYFDPTTSMFVPMVTRKVLSKAAPVVRNSTVKVTISLSARVQR